MDNYYVYAIVYRDLFFTIHPLRTHPALPMPLLHIQIKNNEQRVDLHQDLKAQRMRLRCVTVSYGTPTAAREAGVLVDISEMLGVGREISASLAIAGSSTLAIGNQDLYLPRPGLVGTSSNNNPYFVTLDLDVSFDTDDIPQAFNVRVYNATANKGLAVFSDAAVHEINLYFEYSSNDLTHAS